MKLKHFTIGALALIGAGEIIHRVVQGTAWALSAWRARGAGGAPGRPSGPHRGSAPQWPPGWRCRCMACTRTTSSTSARATARWTAPPTGRTGGAHEKQMSPPVQRTRTSPRGDGLNDTHHPEE